MNTRIRRLLCCLLAAVLSAGIPSLTSAEAALAKPGNCRFEKWSNSHFTSCQIAWDAVPGAADYILRVSYTDGSHSKDYTTPATSYTIKGLADNHVYVARVQARSYDPATGKATTGSFSNYAYITPCPTEVSLTISNKSRISSKIKWNPIYGSSGYNVFLSTNPSGKWYWDQSTAVNATATSATIKKFRGKKLEKYKTYYVRLVTRRKRNGVFCTVPIPSSSYYNFGFVMAQIR